MTIKKKTEGTIRGRYDLTDQKIHLPTGFISSIFIHELLHYLSFQCQPGRSKGKLTHYNGAEHIDIEEGMIEVLTKEIWGTTYRTTVYTHETDFIENRMSDGEDVGDNITREDIITYLFEDQSHGKEIQEKIGLIKEEKAKSSDGKKTGTESCEIYAEETMTANSDSFTERLPKNSEINISRLFKLYVGQIERGLIAYDENIDNLSGKYFLEYLKERYPDQYKAWQGFPANMKMPGGKATFITLHEWQCWAERRWPK